MSAAEHLAQIEARVEAALIGLPDDARMDAYYYGFDRTHVGPIDAILSAVAVAGKGAHQTESWGDGSEWGYYSDRPGLPANPYSPRLDDPQPRLTGEPGSASRLIELTAIESAQRVSAAVGDIPALVKALRDVLAIHHPETWECSDVFWCDDAPHSGTDCAKCADAGGGYPCPTVRAIEDTLGGAE